MILLEKWMLCLIFLLGHIVLVTELMARPSTSFGSMLCYWIIQLLTLW